VDIMHDEHDESLFQPSRRALFDDLLFYMRHYTKDFFATHNPGDAALLIKELTLAHYGPLLGFVKHQVHGMRAQGWVLQEKDLFDDRALDVEKAWSRFRITEYMQALKSVMFDLGMPMQQSTPGNIEDLTLRYQYVYADMLYERTEYDRITESIAALAGITGRRQAILEAQRSREQGEKAAVHVRGEATKIRAVTVLATFIATLSLVSQLFSMQGGFAPGGPRHGWYWAYALLAAMAAVLLVLLAEWGIDKSARWNSENLGKSLQAVLRNSRRSV
jgi:hypothetical protein